MRTAAVYIIISVVLWALWLWPTQDTPSGQTMWSQRASLVRVEIESQGQKMILRAGDQVRWLEVRAGNKTLTYPTDPKRATDLLMWLKQPVAQRIESPASMETYGLAKGATIVRVISTDASPQTLRIGKPTYGQKGFYLQRADQPGVVYVSESPSVRWLKFAQGYLPDNHLHPLTYQTTQRIEVDHGDLGKLKMTQKQIDRADFAYWSWDKRQGASRMARRYAKTLLGVRFSGAVIPTGTPSPQPSPQPSPHISPHITWTFTGTDQRMYTIRVAQQGTRWLISSSWLEDQWFRLSAKTAKQLHQVWLEMKQAETTEQLYPPPNPNEPAHHEH